MRVAEGSFIVLRLEGGDRVMTASAETLAAKREVEGKISALNPSQVVHLEAILKNFVTQARESGELPVDEFITMAEHSSHASSSA